MNSFSDIVLRFHGFSDSDRHSLDEGIGIIHKNNNDSVKWMNFNKKSSIAFLRQIKSGFTQKQSSEVIDLLIDASFYSEDQLIELIEYSLLDPGNMSIFNHNDECHGNCRCKEIADDHDCYCIGCKDTEVNLTLFPTPTLMMRINNQALLITSKGSEYVELDNLHGERFESQSKIKDLEWLNHLIFTIESRMEFKLWEEIAELSEDWDEKNYQSDCIIEIKNNKLTRLIRKEEKYTFISHKWETKSQPDPTCQITQTALRRHKCIWIDHLSLPIKNDNPIKKQILKEGLSSMYHIQSKAKKSVKINSRKCDLSYFKSVWCIAEYSLIGDSPIFDYLYKMKSQTSLVDLINRLKLTITNHYDIGFISNYFGLHGGMRVDGKNVDKITLTSIKTKVSNGKVRNILKKLQNIDYELPKGGQIEIEFPNNELSVVEIINKKRRSLIKRFRAKVKVRKKNEDQTPKNSFRNHRIRKKKLKTSILGDGELVYEQEFKTKMFWVDEWDRVQEIVSKISEQNVETAKFCKSPLFPAGCLYKNLCKGVKLVKALNIDNFHIDKVAHLDLKYFYWVKTIFYTDIIRYYWVDNTSINYIEGL